MRYTIHSAVNTCAHCGKQSTDASNPDSILDIAEPEHFWTGEEQEQHGALAVGYLLTHIADGSVARFCSMDCRNAHLLAVLP